MPIKITYKNGEIFYYNDGDYTGYEYKKDIFVVIKDCQWIGIHSMGDIRRITIGGEEIHKDFVNYIPSGCR